MKKNPIFAMSLDSKELFHSNFLAWLLSDNGPKDRTEKLRRFFGNRPDRSTPDFARIDREKNHFDLILHDQRGWETYHTVVENKFKSIPRMDQLCEYSGTICDSSDLRGKTTGILLAPKISIDRFLDKYRQNDDSKDTSHECKIEGSEGKSYRYEINDEGCETVCKITVKNDSGKGKKRSREEEPPSVRWYFRSYDDLIEKFGDFDNDSTKEGIIVREYAAFVRILLDELSILQDQGYFPTQDGHRALELLCGQHMTAYADLKIGDMIQKLWAEYLGLALKREEFRSGEYSNGTAILTFRHESNFMSEGDFYAIQIQAGTLKAALHITPADKEKCQEALNRPDSSIRSFLREAFRNTGYDWIPMQKNVKDGWTIRKFYDAGKGKGVFIYEYIDLTKDKDTLSVEKLRDLTGKVFRNMDEGVFGIKEEYLRLTHKKDKEEV